jgi:hypothetical protein
MASHSKGDDLNAEETCRTDRSRGGWYFLSQIDLSALNRFRSTLRAHGKLSPRLLPLPLATALPVLFFLGVIASRSSLSASERVSE